MTQRKRFPRGGRMNKIIFQYFEWYLDKEDFLWRQLKESSKDLSAHGVTDVWLPPAYKGIHGDKDAGYGVYDLFDLGEFDQKNSIATKYGSKEEYLEAVASLKALKIGVLPDIVFNHKMGADEKEKVEVEIINPVLRSEVLGEMEIEAWTKFNFPKRNNKYSQFVWNKKHFKGIDYAVNKTKDQLYRFKGKKWDENIDRELHNYDYLMGADVDVEDPEVFQELVNFGRWYDSVIGFDGFRLDAVKHINFGFFKKWIEAMKLDKKLFVIGEYWTYDLRALNNYLMEEEFSMSLFDVPLHYNFYEASKKGARYDMRDIFKGSLVLNNPDYAITFVDNHDTQIGQSLESWILSWFKQLAYALILLRPDGTPTVFYGDYYGVSLQKLKPVKNLPLMMKLRKDHMHGFFRDYMDDAECVGWTYDSGLVVLMSNDSRRLKKMHVGKKNADKIFEDIINPEHPDVLIDEKGNGIFEVDGKDLAIYLEKE